LLGRGSAISRLRTAGPGTRRLRSLVSSDAESLPTAGNL